MDALNTNSPLPLYHQLARKLTEDIRSGKYPVGSRIPSEPQLAQAFKIGRPTVRQATDLLVRQRRVERRRGSGTFVVEVPDRLDVLSLAGTLASFEKTGLSSESSIVEELRRCTVKIGDACNALAGHDAWYFRRLSKVEQSPALLESMWLSTEQFPNLGETPLAGRSLSQLAADHYHLRATSADQAFSLIAAAQADADWLEVPAGSPLLMVKRCVHFPAARNAVYSELICRTDQFEFCQTIVVDDSDTH